MPFENPSDEKIKEILLNARTIAVVGLSDNPDKTSYMVSQAMQSKGFKIIPVNPNAEEILGEKSYAKLADIPEKVDIVNVFRRSEYCAPVAEEAAAIHAGTVWLQQGIVNEEAAAIAEANGMNIIMDRCIKVMDAYLNRR